MKTKLYNVLTLFLCFKEITREKLLQFFWHLIGNLFPLGLGLLIFAIPEIKWLGIKAFIKDGQFYIYSVALLASAIYIFWSFKVINTDKYAMHLYASTTIGFLASLFYALFLVNVINDYKTIKYTSLIFFVFSVFLYYRSIMLNLQVDVQETQRKKIQNIADDLS